MQEPFYVQLHLHTCETSRCGVDSGAEMARACKRAGYGMIAVTDHFMNANIGCPSGMRWADKVEYLFRGHRAAQAEGEKLGLIVLKGWETYTGGPEVLTYGLGEEFLLAHPDIDRLPLLQYLALVNRAGGFCVHAHPYREAFYIPKFQPDASAFEAFEVYNASHAEPRFNQRALKAAQEAGLIMTAGSDAHSAGEVRFGAMRFPGPLGDFDQLIRALRARTGEIVPEMPAPFTDGGSAL